MHSPVKGAPHIRGKSFNNAFGDHARKNPDGTIRPHQGWDISSPPGTPVYAVKHGIIAFVKDSGNQGYGKQVCLEFHHRGQTLYPLYAHLETIDVVPGMFVAEGEQLGTSGQTGNAHGQALSEAHLHFEIRTKTTAGSGVKNRLDPSFVLGNGPIREIIHELFAGIPSLPPIPKF